MKKPMWKPSLRMPKWRWGRVILIVVGLLVVASVGRALLGGLGKGAVDTTGQGGNNPTAKATPTPEQTVEIDGRKVPGKSGPVAVLNPGLARPGAQVTVSASGFDAGSSVQVLLSADTPGSKPTSVGSGRADKDGAVSAEFTVPMDVTAKQVVTVQQDKGDKAAAAELVPQAGVGTLKLSDKSGAPGATVGLDAEGFSPGEQVNAYWGRAGGAPAATLKADEAGRLSKASIKVGVAPEGDSTLVLIGDTSKTTATAPFTMLGLYPTMTAKPYAIKAGNTIGLSAGGFAPEERVLVNLNQSAADPAIVLQSDASGSVSADGFKVPFGLKGQQTLILTGEQSRASVSGGFLVLPYSPTARTSTYGGLPGTVLNFYGKDFAPNEVVKVYTGGTENSQGDLVAAFRVDAKGSASAAGSYTIPGDAQGKLTFTLVGAKSEGSATTTVTVDKSDGPVNVPPQPKYELPPDLQGD